MKNTQSVAVCLLFAAGLSAHAEKPCSDPGYSWKKLDATFQKAKSPSRQVMVGQWIATGFVMTQGFRGGRQKDFIQSDCTGIKRNGELEWALRFLVTPDDGMEVESKKLGDHPQSRRISFEPDGTLILEQDDEGDSMSVYRCRIANDETLVCVNRGTQGHGMEFRKQKE